MNFLAPPPKMQRVVLLLAVVLSGTAYAETVVGRWLDKQIPNMPKYDGVLVIVETGAGAIEMRRRYGDGSSGVTKLLEAGRGVYLAEGSSTGDGYRIIPSSGDLQLFDNDGKIRVATRLASEPDKGEGEPAAEPDKAQDARVPSDLAKITDDDIIAKTLRESALAEDDPQLQEKLWEEYRKYKGLR